MLSNRQPALAVAFAITLVLLAAEAMSAESDPGAKPATAIPFPLQLPAGCHAEMRTQSVMVPQVPYRALTALGQLQAYDVLCVGHEIIVDQPLRSSGGNVVILAERVVLNAPIDTRPYFRATLSHFVAPDQWPRYPTDPKVVANDWFVRVNAYWNSKDTSADQVIDYDANQMKFFRDYYSRAPDQLVSSGEVWLPELPGGLTPPVIHAAILEGQGVGRPSDYPRSGISVDPRVYDPLRIRSGDIVIATKALAAPGAGQKFSAPDPFDCSVKPNASLALLTARGARGARGGLGQPNPCLGILPSGRFECPSSGVGTNAAGGPGGAAGNVFWYKIQPASPAGASSEPKDLADVSGGDPGTSTKFRVPEPVTGIASTCAVPRLPSWTPNASGTGGVYRESAISEDEAWRVTVKLAKTFDSMFPHDVVELATRLGPDPSDSSLSFHDFLVSQMQRLVLAAESNLIADTIRLVQGGTATDPGIVAAWEASLRGPPTFDKALPVDVQYPLSYLYELSGAQGWDRVNHFFQLSGGVLANLDMDERNVTILTQLRNQMQRSLVQETDIKSLLQQMRSQQIDFRIDRETREYSRSLDSLKARIADAQAKAAEDAKKFDAKSNALALQFAKAIGTFAAAVATDGAALPALGTMGQTIVDGESLSPALAANTNELQKALNEAMVASEAYQAHAELLRRQAIARNAQALVEARAAQNDSDKFILARMASIPVLYKQIWRYYFHDPSRNITTLKKYLFDLYSMAQLDSEPDTPNPPAVDTHGCSRGDRGLATYLDSVRLHFAETLAAGDNCLVIRPNPARRRVAYGETKLAGNTVRLAIYVVDPSVPDAQYVDTSGLEHVVVLP